MDGRDFAYQYGSGLQAECSVQLRRARHAHRHTFEIQMPAIFRKRTELIRQGLDDAQRASTEATLRLSAIESRLAKIGCEIARMQSIADQQWQAEEERIRAAAEEDLMPRRIAGCVGKRSDRERSAGNVERRIARHHDRAGAGNGGDRSIRGQGEIEKRARMAGRSAAARA